MALSTVYRVVTRYETDTARAESRLSRLSGKVDRLSRQSDRLRTRFASMFRFATRAAVGFATLGLGLAARQALRLNKEMEDAKNSIASAFQLQGIGDFTSNVRDAERMMSKFRKASIASPGTSGQFRSIAGAVSPGLADAGLTLRGQDQETITQFVGRAVGAAFSQMGGDVKTTQGQLLQMMQGRSGADLQLFNILKKPLAETLGVEASAKTLNEIAKRDPRKFFDALSESLAGFDEANKAFGQSFSGLWASIQEVFNNTLLVGAQPLFDFLKGSMRDLLKWTEDNHAEIEAFATSVGEKLTKGFQLAAAAVKGVANNLEVVVALLGTVMARKAGLAIAAAVGPGGIARGAGSFVASNVASGMARGRQLAGGVRSGAGRALGFAGDFAGEAMFGFLGSGSGGGRGGALARGMKQAPGRLKSAAVRQWMGQGINFDTLSKGAGKAGGALMAGGKGLLAGLTTTLSGLLTVVAPLIVVLGMVVGTFRVLKDTTNEATIFLMTSWNELLTMLDVVAMQFGQGGGFVQAMKDFVDWLGTGVVGVFGLVVKGVERVVAAFTFMIAVFKGFAIGIGTLVKRVQSGGLTALLDAPQILSNEVNTQLGQRDQQILEAMKQQQERRENERKSEEKKKKDADTRNRNRPKVEVHINQDIKTNENPDRIAFRTRDILEKSLMRNKRAASVLSGG